MVFCNQQISMLLSFAVSPRRIQWQNIRRELGTAGIVFPFSLPCAAWSEGTRVVLPAPDTWGERPA